MTASTAHASEDRPILGIVLGLLRADAPEQIMGSPQDWPRWAVLLPHVLHAADHAGDLPEEAAGSDTAWLLDRAATYLQVHARLAAGRPLAMRAPAIPETAGDPDHPEVSTRLSSLALILRALGLAAEAQPLAERALTIDEAALGPDHPDLAIRLGNLALILPNLAQAAEAQPLAERALTIAETAFGPDPPTVAIRLNNLATILKDLGQAAEAQ